MSEQIHGLVIRDGKVVLTVTSNGCTEPAHFRLEVADADGELAVTVLRTQEDFCKMMPHAIEIELDIPDALKSVAFKVQNSFIITRV